MEEEHAYEMVEKKVERTAMRKKVAMNAMKWSLVDIKRV